MDLYTTGQVDRVTIKDGVLQDIVLITGPVT